MELVLIILLIFFAGLLSAAENSIVSFKKDGIQKKSSNERQLKNILFLKDNIDKLTAAVNISSTICLLAAGSASIIWVINNNYLFFNTDFSSIIHLIYLIIVVAVASIYWILGNLVPKAIGSKYSGSLSFFFAMPLLALLKIFSLPTKFILLLSNAFLIPFKLKASFLQTNISEDEIRVLINEGLKSGEINETEHEFIENVFEFNDLKANEVMIPRTEMVAVKLTDDDADMFNKILKTAHNLIPIYQESLDNIIGIVHIKDLLRQFIEKINVDIKSIMRPAHFVPETKLISEILKEMQKRGERIFVVTDEYGGTEGVITLEDILSEIVGDLGDVKDYTKEYSKLPDGKYVVLGSMDIDDFNELFNHELPISEEYNTVAGFISFYSGRILNVGDLFSHEGITFELIKKIKQKMVQFRVFSTKDYLTEKTNL
jgi:putative hemolysin